MKTYRPGPRQLWFAVVVGAIAMAAGIAANAVAGAAELPKTTTVCIKPNGQIRAVTPENPVCVEPEAAAEWTVNGLKAITPGAGLVGRDDGGIVALEVDPGLIENANSGKIVAGFDDGPRPVPDELTLIAQLPLPAGSYAIFAKLWVHRPRTAGLGPRSVAPVTCRLVAGADFDEASVTVEPFDTEAALFGGEGTSALALSLEVVHPFDGPSRALLSCADTSFFFPVGDVVYQDLKIIAVRGSSLSNTFIGP